MNIVKKNIIQLLIVMVIVGIIYLIPQMSLAAASPSNTRLQAANYMVNNVNVLHGKFVVGSRTFYLVNQAAAEKAGYNGWSGFCNRAVAVTLKTGIANSKKVGDMLYSASTTYKGKSLMYDNGSYNASTNSFFGSSLKGKGSLQHNVYSKSYSYVRDSLLKYYLTRGYYLGVRIKPYYTGASGITWTTDTTHWVAILAIHTDSNGTTKILVADPSSRGKNNSKWYNINEFGRNKNAIEYVTALLPK